MSLKKTATIEQPHATFARQDAGWEWKVLKTYKAPASEAKDEYARWLVAAKSPHTYGEWEQGDTYVSELRRVTGPAVSCTQEFADAYPDRINSRTTITDATSADRAVVLDTPEGIDFFVMASLKGRLKMEIAGLKGRGRSAYAQAKEMYGLKGSRQKVLDQMEAMVAEALGEDA